jgi:hypothetical protein
MTEGIFDQYQSENMGSVVSHKILHVSIIWAWNTQDEILALSIRDWKDMCILIGSHPCMM